MLPLVHPEPTIDLRKADACDLLMSLAPRSVDCIITDPAYDTLEEHREHGSTARLTTEWFEVFDRDRYPALFGLMARALKTNGHLYVFCDPPTMFLLKPIAESAGFRLRKPIIWDKVSIGMGYSYRSRYEVILFFDLGESRALTDKGVPDILTFKALRGAGLYPTQKPTALIDVFVRQSAIPGELVVDPFMGSGVVGESAVSAGCSFLGGDVSDKALRRAAARLGVAA